MREISTLSLLKVSKVFLTFGSEDLSYCKKLADNESTYYKMVDITSFYI